MSPRGRYAPSPTGDLHVGNAATALLAWLSVRSASGCFVMRVEDLDPARSRAELVEGQLRDLSWLGLDWDEGPYPQSRRGEDYDRAFAALRHAGRVYPCFCSRKDVRAAAGAPQAPGEAPAYSGTCRTLAPVESRTRIEAGEKHSWRFAVTEPPPPFEDRRHGRCEPGPPTDFVVRRSDGVTAYQLAVVVDDAAMGIDEVVRGEDLLESTGIQGILARALGLPQPVYGHAPLWYGPDGRRLSKRHAGITLRELREAGVGSGRLVAHLAREMGLVREARSVTPAELVADFDWERIPPPPAVVSFTADLLVG